MNALMADSDVDAIHDTGVDTTQATKDLHQNLGFRRGVLLRRWREFARISSNACVCVCFGDWQLYAKSGSAATRSHPKRFNKATKAPTCPRVESGAAKREK
jgi:hypothetical protein